MVIEKAKIRNQKTYSIGYISVLEKYVLSIVVPWISWYERYYEISEEEYLFYQNHIDKLDLLSEELKRAENRHERFLFSEKTEENDEEQNKLLRLCLDAIKPKDYEVHKAEVEHI